MSEDRMLRYKKTLDIIEKFMIDSRIREYCTDICKGNCCITCYKDNKEACYRQEGRRLSCSAFVCYAITNLISGEDELTFLRIRRVIEDEYSRFSPKNQYFNTPTPRFFRQSLFSSKIIEALDDKMAERIKEIITILIVNKKNVRKTAICKSYIERKLKEEAHHEYTRLPQLCK